MKQPTAATRNSSRWAKVGLLLILFTSIAAIAGAQGIPETPEEVDPEQIFIRASDSSHARIPEYLRNAVPIVPYSGEAAPMTGDPTVTETYNVSTGEVTRSGPPSMGEGLEGDDPFVEGFAGADFAIAALAGTGDRSVIGTDGRVRINATTTYPWRSIVRLAIKWTSGGGTGVCSGAMIDAYHVLTAGHCVFDYGGTDDWAYSIVVFPGLNDGSMPYNYAKPTFYRSYTGWTNSGNSEHDWAVITLDRNIGNFTGWMGRWYAPTNDSMYTNTLNVSGYPGTPNGSATCPSWGNCQYFDADIGHSATDNNHWYWMDTSGGMSGSPVWRFRASDSARHILSVHTCGLGGCGLGNNGTNHGTRLNEGKNNSIAAWFAADTPPTDKADLIDDGQTWSGFSPSTVRSGINFSAYSDVRNVGTANSGSFSVSYYLSSNTFISTSDYLVANDTVSSISPFNYGDSSIFLSFPSNIPDGTYYLGWIIDRFGVVSEFDEGNNTEYSTDGQVTVCHRAATPTLLSPGSGATISDLTPLLDWTTSSAADSYRIQVDNDINFSSPLIDTNTGPSLYQIPTSLTAGTYYWRVRADNSCGTDGLWTSTRRFILDYIFVDGFESGNTSAWSP